MNPVQSRQQIWTQTLQLAACMLGFCSIIACIQLLHLAILCQTDPVVQFLVAPDDKNFSRFLDRSFMSSRRVKLL